MESNKSFRFQCSSTAIGHAIVVGNLWRFPWKVINNDGGAFVVAYIIALLVWSVPLLIAEAVMGYKARRGPVWFFRDVMGDRYTWMGGFMAFVCFALGAYHAVIMGWIIRFFTWGIWGIIKHGIDTQVLWSGFMASSIQGMLFHAIAVTVTALIVLKGGHGVMKNASKFVVYALYILLVTAMIKALTLPGASTGLNFLFKPDFNRLLNGEIWLEAFAQSAWSTGAGWGFMLSYLVYFEEKQDVILNGFIPNCIALVMALVAAMAVIPTMFALAPQGTEIIGADDAGFTFIWMAKLFCKMRGGAIAGTLFFLAVFFVAIISLCNMYEVVMRNFVDIGWSRKKAAVLVIATSFVAGLPSAVNVEFLKNQDQVWSRALVVSGLLISLALAKCRLDQVHLEDMSNKLDISIGKWWKYCIFFFPGMFVLTCGGWVYRQVIWHPHTWWNPFEIYGPMTAFAQWALIIGIFMSYNTILVQSIESSKIYACNNVDHIKKPRIM